MLFKKQASAYDFMICGLGNPGLQYQNTRHNVGFMAADRLAEKFNAEFSHHKPDAVFGDCSIAGRRVLMVKPQTYMNLSGEAVQRLSAFYKIPSDKILIMADDISLGVGRLRIRRKGSDGGHNGLKDIIQLLGTDEILRIKIGVGERPSREYDLKDWVLGKFNDEQKKLLDTALDNAVKAVEEILKNGIDSAMNKYNS